MRYQNIAVHHPSARMGYAIPIALEKEQFLFKVFTDFYPTPSLQFISKQLDFLTLSKFTFHQSLMKRYSTNLSNEKVVDLGFDGFRYNFIRSQQQNHIKRLKITLKLSELISKKISRYSDNFDLVYAFALGGVSCRKFMPTKPLILDQMQIPIVSLIDVIKHEELVNADWFGNSVNPYKGSEDFLVDTEKKDLDSSNLILAPSEFVKQTLQNRYQFEDNQILLNPYAAPAWLHDYPTCFREKFLERDYSNEKLNILFVGEVGIRKGAHILLQALKKLDRRKYEARLVGNINIPSLKVREYSDICSFMGKMNKSDLAKEYQWADIFVFPSLGEGSAGVIYEAMAFGLPIITTFSSGSHVREGVDGYIVPESDIDALVDRINVYIKEKPLLASHSLNSWNRVKDFSIEKTSLRFREIFAQIQKMQF